ncbi:MAG TPA: magnesium transporter CorA family protein, partial [Nitrososphaeraceae archaeon]|nr:magnesium transporter CorA family protein [Nitrososphaeraceae archaeon]
KIEEYDEYLFAIVDGVRYDEEEQKQNKNDGDDDDKYGIRLIEDDLFIFFERRWIITINFYNHKFEENIRKKVKNLQQSMAASKQSSSNSSTKDRGGIYGICEIIYRLAIEEIISSYYPVLDKANNQLEQIEEYILDSPSKAQLSNILVLRRKISFLEGSLGMVSRAFHEIISGVVQTRLSDDSRRQIRSLNDRVTYLRNNIENMHHRVISLREAYNSSLTANLNETIRTLTVIATIVLPLTLIAGIYGMNFDIMPELRSPFGYYYALGLMAAVGGGMIAYFKWKKWI